MKPSFEKYKFRWQDLGDIQTGRPNIGQQLPVAVYRLAQYTLREAIALHYGDEVASLLLREAGWIAGREFCKSMLDVRLEFPAFVDQLQKTLKEQLIGVLRVEKADLQNLTFTLTVPEDLDCSASLLQGKRSVTTTKGLSQAFCTHTRASTLTPSRLIAGQRVTGPAGFK